MKLYKIPLTKGQFTIVDAADYPSLSQHKWCAVWHKQTQSYFAMRVKIVDGARICVVMAREILGLRPGDPRVAEHGLHNRLDNRRFVGARENLRIATPSQNMHNCCKQRNNTSGYTGVTFERGLWRADITTNGVRKFLGYAKTAKKAGTLYTDEALRARGKFAYAR